MIISWGSRTIPMYVHAGENWVGWEKDRTSADTMRWYRFVSRATSHPQAQEQSSRCQHWLANVGAFLVVECSSPATLGREPPIFFTQTTQSEPTLRLLSGDPGACIWVLGLRIPWLWDVEHLSSSFGLWHPPSSPTFLWLAHDLG